MNHIYHSIWNEALNAWIAVSEIATGQGKRSSNRRNKPMTASPLKDWQSSTMNLVGEYKSLKPARSLRPRRFINNVGMSLLLFSSASWALPTGNELIAGQATVTTPTAAQMQINQASQNAVINWQGFSIAPNQAVNIQQPNAQAALLNRVVGQTASQIQGQLNANGQVYIVNPNGVIFGKTAQVDVGGLVATTHEISNQDFMNGKNHFTQNGATGKVENHGTIKTPEGGIVALIGTQVSNTGTIETPKGTTALAAGKTIDLDFQGNGLVEVKVTEAALNAQINNQGAIKANGGQVILTANAAGQLIDTVINSQGVIQARGLVEKNGVIKLSGGNTGTVEIGGIIDTSNVGWGEARTPTSSTTGGDITVTGANINLQNGASLNASGNTGGGNINLGDKQTTRQTTIQQGATVTANTQDSGTAGTINVLANMNDGKVQINGQLNAAAPKNGDGGFIDTSAAHVNVADSAEISTKAANGKTGKWLIDPTDYKIAASGGNLTGAALANYLKTSNIEIQTLATGTTGQGDIFVNTPVTWNNFNELILTAHRNVNITAPINANGGGSVRLRADSLGTGTGTVAFTGTGHVTVNNGAAVGIYYNPVSYTDAATKSDSTGNPYSSKLTLNTGSYATAYMLVNDVNKLQAMNTNLSGNYALGKNIDASATTTWNSGAGFLPVGSSVLGGFSGNFQGLAHTITGLSINRPATDFVGLFSRFSPINRNNLISNVGLVGGSVTGKSYVGGLAGNNNATINNTYNTGSVTGDGYVGGLLGYNGLARLDNSYATGNVKGGAFGSVGGLVGGNNLGTINNSYATGNVDISMAISAFAGGLVGLNTANSTISNAYATGNINYGRGTEAIGGLVGKNDATSTINNTYATGSMTTTDPRATGVLKGGLAGLNAGQVNNSYWDTTTSGQTTSAGGTGKTTAQMKQQASFTGWDFANTWKINRGVSYPTLQVQTPVYLKPTPTILTPPVVVPPPPPTTTPPATTTPPPATVTGTPTNNANAGNPTTTDITPTNEATQPYNPFLGLDANALYTAVIASDLANTYSISPYWQILKTSNGGIATQAQIDANIMLNAYNRYKNYSGQALADLLYQDVITGGFKINDITITNDSNNLLWKGSYGGALQANSSQVEANTMIKSYQYYQNVSAEQLFADLIKQGVSLSGGNTANDYITNSPSNAVWRGIYGTDMQASAAQKTADDMMKARYTYYGNANALLDAVNKGVVIVEGNRWNALDNGWTTGNRSSSQVQLDVLAALKQQQQEAAQLEATKRAVDNVITNNNSTTTPKTAAPVGCQAGGACGGVEIVTPNNTKKLPAAWSNMSQQQLRELEAGSAEIGKLLGVDQNKYLNKTFELRQSFDDAIKKADAVASSIPKDFKIGDTNLIDYINLRIQVESLAESVNKSNQVNMESIQKMINPNMHTSLQLAAGKSFDRLDAAKTKYSELKKVDTFSIWESNVSIAKSLVKATPVLAKYEVKLLAKPVVITLDTAKEVKNNIDAASTVYEIVKVTKKYDVEKVINAMNDIVTNTFKAGKDLHDLFKETDATKLNSARIDLVKELSDTMKALNKLGKLSELEKIGKGTSIASDLGKTITAITEVISSMDALNAINRLPEQYLNDLNGNSRSFLITYIENKNILDIATAVTALGKVGGELNPLISPVTDFASDLKDVEEGFFDHWQKQTEFQIDQVNKQNSEKRSLLIDMVQAKSEGMKQYGTKLGDMILEDQKTNLQKVLNQPNESLGAKLNPTGQFINKLK